MKFPPRMLPASRRAQTTCAFCRRAFCGGSSFQMRSWRLPSRVVTVSGTTGFFSDLSSVENFLAAPAALLAALAATPNNCVSRSYCRTFITGAPQNRIRYVRGLPICLGSSSFLRVAPFGSDRPRHTLRAPPVPRLALHVMRLALPAAGRVCFDPATVLVRLHVRDSHFCLQKAKRPREFSSQSRFT